MPFPNLNTPFNDSASQSTTSRRQVSLICFSNVVASFDFLIYIHLAAIISDNFFPYVDNAWLAQLQVLSLYAVGFIARPLGGFLVGRYGDIHGRKPALKLTLSFLTITTLLTVFLPTYNQVGIVAPILFVILRLCQGMAFGAHAPLSWVFVSEYTNRYTVATYCGLVASSLVLGTLVALVFFSFINNNLTQTEMLMYGWRLSFLTGGIFSLISLAGWYVFSETPLFESVKHKAKPRLTFNDMTQYLKHRHTLFLSFSLCFIQASVSVVVLILLPELIAFKFSIDPAYLTSASLVGLLFMMIGCVFYGLFADKSGLGKALMLAALMMALQALAFYYHLMNSNGEYILLMYALLGFCGGIIGLCPAIIVQLFPTIGRLTAFSTVYNIAFAVMGSVLPFALFYATDLVTLAPALFLVFVSIVAFLIGLYLCRLPNFQLYKDKIIS